jgi:hypothetical protein
VFMLLVRTYFVFYNSGWKTQFSINKDF